MTNRFALRTLAATLLSLSLAAIADPSPAIRLPESWAALELESVPRPREALPDLGAQIEARKSYVIPAAEIIVFDTLLNQWDRHHFPCCDFNSNIHTIRRNLRSSWVVDSDPFTVNQLGHPYQGSMYHGFARSSRCQLAKVTTVTTRATIPTARKTASSSFE